MRLTLYGKPGCCLCDEARDAIEEVRPEFGFDVEHVDVSTDPRLFATHGERIPVVEIDGEEAFELGLDADALRRRLGKVGP